MSPMKTSHAQVIMWTYIVIGGLDLFIHIAMCIGMDMGIMASFAHFTVDILLILIEVNTWQVCYIYTGKIPIRYGYYIQLDKFF